MKGYGGTDDERKDEEKHAQEALSERRLGIRSRRAAAGDLELGLALILSFFSLSYVVLRGWVGRARVQGSVMNGWVWDAAALFFILLAIGLAVVRDGRMR